MSESTQNIFTIPLISGASETGTGWDDVLLYNNYYISIENDVPYHITVYQSNSSDINVSFISNYTCTPSDYPIVITNVLTCTNILFKITNISAINS